MAIAVAISACNKDDAAKDPGSSLPDYTIMLYGTGGETLDYSFDLNMDQVEAYGYSSNVQFVALFKYSDEFQNIEECEGTRLFTLTEEGLSNEKVDEFTFLLNDPQNLADFINDTKEEYPAKNYILLFWNHGSTFDIDDQPVKSSYDQISAAKSMLNDDTTGTTTSIFEVEAALEMTTGVDLIYFDTCLMSNIESIYQIKDHTQYTLGSSHLTPGAGGNYAQLFASLDKYSNIEDAMCHYVGKIEEYWKSDITDSDATSLTLVKTAYLDQLARAIGDYTEVLCDLYGEALESYEDGYKQDLIDIEYYNGCYPDDSNSGFKYWKDDGVLYYLYTDDNDCSSYTVEMKSAFANMAMSAFYDGELLAKSTMVNIALESVVVAENHNNVPSFVDCVCPAITWIDCDLFEEEYTGYDYTLSEIYKMTAFDKATGWSEFLEMNQMELVQ